MKHARSMIASALIGIAAIGLAGCSAGLDSETVEAEDGYIIDILALDGSETLAFDPDDRLAPTEQSTIEFWVQPEWSTDPGYDPIVLSNTGDDGTSYAVAVTAERDGLVGVSGEVVEGVPFDFTDGQLHHVALIDYGDTVSVWIDLDLVAELPLTFENYPSNGFFVGTGSGGDDAFEGKIGGLRIWDVAVEPEVLAQYARRDALGDTPHPDLDELKLISDFSNKTIVFNE
ncbi:MAG: LamG-like jellyroll fold domain-containing protein [Pseudomonadota bacterium]